MEGVYCVVLFVDINQAFYSAIIEFALGPLTLQAVRLVVLQALRFTPEQLDDIEAIQAQHLALLSQYPMAEGLLEVVVGSQIRSYFTVAEDLAPTVLFKGTKPGDPLADLILRCLRCVSCTASCNAQKRKPHFLFWLPSPSVTSFGPSDASLITLPPFSFMDDFCVALRNLDAAQFLQDLPRLPLLIAAEARSFGLQVNFKQGKVEALLAL